MSDLISRCELFNRLSTAQTLADAYAVINSIPTAERIPKSTKEKLLDVLDDFADKTIDAEGGSYESARHKMCEILDGE